MAVFVGGGTTTALSAATYNPANQSVTLAPASVLPLNRLYRLDIDGSARPVLGNGLADIYGGLLEGSSGVPGTPYVVIFGAGTRLTYNDDQGNVVTLQLRQGGIMDVVPVAGRRGPAARADRRRPRADHADRLGEARPRRHRPDGAAADLRGRGVHIKLKGRPFAVAQAATATGGRPLARRAWHR